MGNKFNTEIMCSNCGSHKTVPNKLNAIDDVCCEGWSSFGAALYCPDCSATWYERNSKPLAGKQNTFTLIVSKVIEEFNRRTPK